MPAWITLIVVTLLVAIAPRGLRRGIAFAFARLASRSILSASIVFLIALVLGAMPTLLNRAPIPSVHDEFSNLLLADTLLHGRLTNPTPPMWEHFETIHELMRPTYASKFPPVPGMALAIGKLFGSYAIGAFGTVALACAMIVIALRQWISPTWALAGGLLAAMNPLVLWWGQSYWGGGVAMLGGAILFAGAGRMLRRNDLLAGTFIGTGLAILAMSRPFEGLLAAIVLCIAIVIFAKRRARPSARLIVGASIVLVPAIAWLGYYNFRVTGSWRELPWSAYASQSMSTPTFLGQPMPREPMYRDDKLRQFHAGLEASEYSREISSGYLGRLVELCEKFFADWFDPRAMYLLTPAMLIAIWRKRAARIAAMVFLGLMLLHPALTPWFRPQYLAPAVCCLLALTALALREIARIPRLGIALAIGLLVAQFHAGLSMIVTTARNEFPPGYARWKIVEDLQREPGAHLVLVRYTPAVQLIFEWVYNDADIETSKVVFARSIDAQSDRELLKHFRDRTQWILTVDGRSISLDRVTDRATGP